MRLQQLCGNRSVATSLVVAASLVSAGAATQWIGCSAAATVADTFAAAPTPLCKSVPHVHPEPVDELYRTMFGRNATWIEVQHFAETVIQGYQIAQQEPYPTYLPYKFVLPEPLDCTSFVGRTDDPEYAGIPYLKVYFAGHLIDDQDEYRQNGPFSTVVIGLFRTYFCRLPTQDELHSYISFYASHKLGSDHLDRTGAQALIQYMEDQKILSGQTEGPCWDVVDDVMERVLGRPPVTEGCDYTTAEPPDPSIEDPGHPGSVTSCYWFWLLTNGWIATDDLLHIIRSSKEALIRNENAQCYAQNAVTGEYLVVLDNQFLLEPLGYDGLPVENQVKPHAVGEYVSQIYRLFLGRFPQPMELAGELARYPSTGGDTKDFLHNIADRIVNPTNPQNGLTRYSEYGGYTEYFRQGDQYSEDYGASK